MTRFDCPHCKTCNIPTDEAEAHYQKHITALEVRIAELKAMLSATLPYFAKMQADGIQTVITPATVAEKIEALLEKEETHEAL